MLPGPDKIPVELALDPILLIEGWVSPNDDTPEAMLESNGLAFPTKGLQELVLLLMDPTSDKVAGTDAGEPTRVTSNDKLDLEGKRLLVLLAAVFIVELLPANPLIPAIAFEVS